MPASEVNIFDGKGWLTVFKPGRAAPFHENINRPPTLREMQGFVEGYVELVCAFTHTESGVVTQVYVNEEGRVRGMTANAEGTSWLKAHWPHLGHTLVGPVAVLTGPKAVWR